MLYNVIYCIVGGESEELDIWSLVNGVFMPCCIDVISD